MLFSPLLQKDLLSDAGSIGRYVLGISSSQNKQTVEKEQILIEKTRDWGRRQVLPKPLLPWDPHTYHQRSLCLPALESSPKGLGILTVISTLIFEEVSWFSILKNFYSFFMIQWRDFPERSISLNVFGIIFQVTVFPSLHPVFPFSEWDSSLTLRLEVTNMNIPPKAYYKYV